MHESLTSAKAASLQAQFGLNEIHVASQKTLFSMFLSQFASIFTYILLAAGGFSFLIKDYLDGGFILGIIILNSTLGFIQEFKAEKAIEKLKQQSIFVTRVIRDGKEQEIDNRQLVPGDIVKLEAGSKVPSDALLIETTNLEVDEAILTGESVPVFKHHSDPEACTIFMGTIVMKGKCTAVVTTTGMNTKFGKLTKTLSAIQEVPTQLSKYVTHLGKQLSVIGILSGISIFVIFLLRHEPFFEAILTSISLVVAVVPEGLPAIITIAFAVGASRIAKKRLVVRKMAAIETLGEVSVIATDKTGTITQNKMEVKKLWLGGKIFHVGEKLPEKTDKTFEKFLQISLLCNNSQLFHRKDSPPEIIGDKTEGALLVLADKVGLSSEAFKSEWRMVDEFSFDDLSKSMTVFYKKDAHLFVFSKGAPENILNFSTKISSNGTVRILTQEEKQKIQIAFQSFAKDGLRLIGLAYKEFDNKKKKYTREEGESDLVFIGFAGIADPIRPEVKQAIQQARDAGITTVMITGDHELTAQTIAIEAGLIKKGEAVITATQLDELSEKELTSLLSEVKVFARCTPNHKLRIVQAYQKLNNIVAVTGDGINDAPCLKQANVGIAMGITGTDVTREAADIVITDDNFATIVTGIEEGRIIFDNLIKSISYLIAGNFSEILTIVIAALLGFPNPLLPVHILWINVVTDSLPAIALALDTKLPNVMKRIPIDPSRPLISGRTFAKLALLSLLITLVTLGVYWWLIREGNLLFARTAVFTMLIWLQMVLAFALKDRRTWHTNRLLLISVSLVLISQLLILFVPFLQAIFHVGF